MKAIFKRELKAYFASPVGYVVVAALLRQPVVAGGAVWDPSEALRFVRQLKDARESVCSVVMSFVLAVFALRREQLKREDSRECRGMLRHVRVWVGA